MISMCYHSLHCLELLWCWSFLTFQDHRSLRECKYGLHKSFLQASISTITFTWSPRGECFKVYYPSNFYLVIHASMHRHKWFVIQTSIDRHWNFLSHRLFLLLLFGFNSMFEASNFNQSKEKRFLKIIFKKY